jgi:hypothetical protein
MLEEEGIVFQSEGGVDRIRQDFFVVGLSDVVVTIGTDSSSSHNKKKQKRTRSDLKADNQPLTKPEISSQKSNPTEIPTEEKLKDDIIALLQKRSPGKTC